MAPRPETRRAALLAHFGQVSGSGAGTAVGTNDGAAETSGLDGAASH